MSSGQHAPDTTTIVARQQIVGHDACCIGIAPPSLATHTNPPRFPAIEMLLLFNFIGYSAAPGFATTITSNDRMMGG
jgi:hypothetical protein